MIITEPQHIMGLPESTYHADPVEGGSLSFSMAKVLVQPGGPAKLRYMLDHPTPRKKVFDFGTAAHQLVLGQGAPIRIIPEELLALNGAASTDAAKAFIEYAYAEGAIPLKVAEAEQVVAMAEALRSNDDAARVLGTWGMRHEVSGFAQDDETGVWLRCRWDMVSPTLVGDYKTAVSAEPGKFARKSMLELGYHMQAAHYLDMAARLGVSDPDAPFVFVVQEKTPPYLPAVVTVGGEYLELGRIHMRRAIELWQQCSTSGVWPGYPATVAEPPQWAMNETYSELDSEVEAELEALLNKNRKVV